MEGTNIKEALSSKPPSSGAIIKDPQGRLLFMRRDDKPYIPHPNKLAILGGVQEDSDNGDIVQTLLREIAEECKVTGLESNQVEHLGLLVAGDDKDHEKHISLVCLTENQVAMLQKGDEGKELVWLTIEEIKAMGPDEFVPDLKIVFFDHIDKIKMWLQGEEISAEDIGLVPAKKGLPI